MSRRGEWENAEMEKEGAKERETYKERKRKRNELDNVHVDSSKTQTRPERADPQG